MARPRGTDENPVSLFPFLSILACVIGTLILLIASVSITQMESDPEEELVERVEEFEELDKQRQEMEAELEKLQPDLSQLDQLRARLELLRQQAEKLRQERQKTVQENKELQDKLAQLDEARKKLLEQIEKLTPRQTEQETTIAQLLEEIQQRRLVNAAPTVRVEPGEHTAKRGNQPVFVEIDKDGLILDPDGQKTRVPAAAIRSDANFKKLLDSMAGNYDKVLVFLIRENGYRLFATAEYTARYNNVMVTKLPILGDGQLDLSRF